MNCWANTKISECGEQRLHTLYMQDKSSKIYTYWKFGEPWWFKQLQNTAPQALIDGANIWTATWLYNIVLLENLASWILDPRNSRCLDNRISKLEAFELQSSEDRVSSFKHRVSTYFWAVSTVACFSLFLNLEIFWMSKKTIIIEFGFHRIWRILQIEKGVIHLPQSA